MKTIKVVYKNQFDHQSTGFLIETMEEWKDAVKKSHMHSATKGGVSSILNRGQKVFVNPFGGYCGIDGKDIKIVKK